MTNAVKLARMNEGMSQLAACKVMGLSNVTYSKKERDPGLFTLRELSRFYAELDEDGQELLEKALNGVKTGEFAS